MSLAPLVLECPIGACRDVKELEYIACLHQTCDENRVDGSISAEDIRILLLSRQGLDVNLKDIEDLILNDLAGSTNRHVDLVMDLRQMVSLLTIPHLVKASKNQNEDLDKVEGNLFQAVFRIILDDIKTETGEEEYPALTTSLLRRILATYGEGDVDDELLEQMIQRANVGHVLGGAIMFTPQAFEYALTSDIQYYNPELESNLSTHFEDVSLSDRDKNRRASMESMFASFRKAKQSTGLLRAFTFPQIDLDADTFDSLIFMVILAATISAFYVGYYNTWNPSDYVSCQDSRFGCTVLKLLLDWFAILVQLTISGTMIVLVMSLGNHAYNTKRSWYTFFKLLLMTSVIPIVTMLVTKGVGPMLTSKTSLFARVAETLFFTSAAALMFIQTGQLISILLPDSTMHSIKSKLFSSWLFSAGSSERDAKMAASFKVGVMVDNALQLHSLVVEEVNAGLLSRTRARVVQDHFTELSRQKERVGGFRWMMRQYWTSALARNEGIFFGARLVVSNVAQWAVLAASLFVVIMAVSQAATTQSLRGNMNAPKLRSLYYNQSGSYLLFDHEAVDSYLEEYNLVYGYVFDDLDATYVDTSTQVATRSLLETLLLFPGITSFSLEDSRTDNYTGHIFDYFTDMTGLNLIMSLKDPSYYRMPYYKADFFAMVSDELKARADDTAVFAGVITAGVTSALVTTFIAVTYLPSYVITVLKFRSGVLGSLHDRRSMYLNKMNPFFTTLLIGSSFWGALFSAATTGLLSGSMVFLVMWDETRGFATAALAVALVIILTWLFRFAVVNCIYLTMSRGFLRDKPASHNLIILMFEAWNMGNSLGYVLSRSVRVLLITLFYLGRLDKWVLADGAGEVLCFHPDIFPRAFNRDLLVHEAHRHPWAQRLVLMYMMKLRFQNRFGNRAGGCWRLIFVSALMPWLMSYKVHGLRAGTVCASKMKPNKSRKQPRDAGVVDGTLPPVGVENVNIHKATRVS